MVFAQHAASYYYLVTFLSQFEVRSCIVSGRIPPGLTSPSARTAGGWEAAATGNLEGLLRYVAHASSVQVLAASEPPVCGPVRRSGRLDSCPFMFIRGFLRATDTHRPLQSLGPTLGRVRSSKVAFGRQNITPQSKRQTFRPPYERLCAPANA